MEEITNLPSQLSTDIPGNISFNHRALYSNPSLTEGVIVDRGFLQSREIAVKTSAKNDIVHYKNDNFARNARFTRRAYLSRKGLKKRDIFFHFFHIKVDDSVIVYNPNYFINRRVIGYGEDYLMGYELYVIDAAGSITSKLDVKKEVASCAVPTFLHSKTDAGIPFKIYAKSFADIAYVYIMTNTIRG